MQRAARNAMAIRTNVGPADRIVRTVAGCSLMVFGAFGLFPGAWRWVIPAAGVLVAATGLIGYCPLYRLLGLGWRAGDRHGGWGEG